MSHSTTIDIVISFDTTGSMYPCLTQVRRNVSALVQNLFTQIPTIRIAIIAHGDYCDGPNTISSLDFSTCQTTICNFVNTVKSTNGGDSPECYELVLNFVRSLNWKSDNKKVLIMIGDDVPHSQHEHQNYKKLDWRNELKLLLESQIKVYGVQALNRNHATSFWNEIANTTGGFHLSLDQFSNIQHIIMAICYQQQGNEYVKEFEAALERNGQINRNLDAIFNTLLRRDSKGRFVKLPKNTNVVNPSRFQIIHVDHDCDISTFVSNQGLQFEKGRGFYQFTKKTTIQPYKEVILQHISTGDMFSGDKAKEIAGIPIGDKNVDVKPDSDSLRGYRCFVQSTSVNRKLIGGTYFLYEVDSLI